MDLSSIKPDTQKVEINHPGTGRPTGFVIEVTSAESDAVKRVQRRHMDKALKSRGKKMSAADIEANLIEKTAAAVVGWEWKNGASWGGKKLDCTPENVATVLETGWVRSQVEEVIGDEAAFFSGAE